MSRRPQGWSEERTLLARDGVRISAAHLDSPHRSLCFVLAVRGFRWSEGRLDLSVRAWIVDTAIAVAIAGPVYWMFTQLLAINLPGLTNTGWL